MGLRQGLQTIEAILSRTEIGNKLPPAAATGRNAPGEDGSAPGSTPGNRGHVGTG
jgi:hypothetical protein